VVGDRDLANQSRLYLGLLMKERLKIVLSLALQAVIGLAFIYSLIVFLFSNHK